MPLPTATDDHQRKNAEALAEAGAAEMMLQSDATGAALAARICVAGDETLGGARMRDERGRRAQDSIVPTAAKVIVDRALERCECGTPR